MTGRFSWSAPGDQMLRYRQSSLIGRGSTALSAPIAPTMLAPTSGTWGAMGLNVVASRTPVQGSGGCGARKRRWPVGGCAKGMPFQTLIEPCLLPCTFPYRVSTIRLLIFLLLLLFYFSGAEMPILNPVLLLSQDSGLKQFQTLLLHHLIEMHG